MGMYEEIARNRRNSFFLITAIVSLLLLCGFLFGEVSAAPISCLSIAFAVSLILVLLSFYAADKAILAVSLAKQIEKKDNPQLFNVVEEMSIASGLPMPKIYIIEDTAPNAFATGRKPELASLAVTTGLLSKLNRDELQGVIAHEMSHIKNYDILYTMLITILVGTIALVCDFFLRSLRYGFLSRRRSSGSRDSVVMLLIFIAAIILGVLAPLFAKILQFAVSRQREYLADASAAQITRYPEGLACALEKIANDKEVLEVANRATQHLYIVNPIKPFESRSQNNIFSTHPPIEERIKRLRAM